MRHCASYESFPDIIQATEFARMRVAQGHSAIIIRISDHIYRVRWI